MSTITARDHLLKLLVTQPRKQRTNGNACTSPSLSLCDGSDTAVWRPPLPVIVKLNCSGARFAMPGKFSVGTLVKDEFGLLVGAAAPSMADGVLLA